jgi:hypothetical protein
MPKINRRSLVQTAAGMGSLFLIPEAEAQTTPPAAAPPPAQISPAMAAAKTVLPNMGYELGTTSNASEITINENNLTINIGPNKLGLNIYVFVQRFTPEQINKLDMRTLFIVNNTHYCNYCMQKSGDDTVLYIQNNIPTSAVTAPVLRILISDLYSALFDNTEVWSIAKWPKQ